VSLQGANDPCARRVSTGVVVGGLSAGGARHICPNASRSPRARNATGRPSAGAKCVRPLYARCHPQCGRRADHCGRALLSRAMRRFPAGRKSAPYNDRAFDAHLCNMFFVRAYGQSTVWTLTDSICAICVICGSPSSPLNLPAAPPLLSAITAYNVRYTRLNGGASYPLHPETAPYPAFPPRIKRHAKILTGGEPHPTDRHRPPPLTPYTKPNPVERTCTARNAPRAS